MKIFWTLILVLAIAGAGMLWLRGSGGRGKQGAPQALPTARETTPPSPAGSAKAPEALKQAPESTATPGTSTREKAEPPAPAPAKPEKPISSPAAQPTAKPVDQPPSVAPATATPSKQESPTTTPAAPSQTTATLPGPTSPTNPTSAPAPASTPTGGHTGVPPPPPEYKPSDQPAKPHSAVVQADGSTLIDERFKVSGDGTKEKPYVIPWDLLVSASEEYSPRDGRTELPQRIKMFDAKYVELTGHVAFPLLVEEPRELLSMLNQWDGCCIGVPPTPYDAVEVKLTKVVKGPDRLASYGIVRGKLKVEPQLVGKWLVALYALSDAELIPKGYGGFTP